jgi:pimeloyl-ACP methyl ester carboxylesterase
MLHYVKNGDYPNQLIFVHGNSQSSKTWEKIFQVKQLKDHFTLIGVDLAGHGDSFRSKVPFEDYSIKGQARHLLDLLNLFENKPYILIGNSLGTNLIGEISPELKNCRGFLFTGTTAFGNGLTMADVIRPNPNFGISFLEKFTEEQLDALVNQCVINATPEVTTLIKTDFRNADPKVRSVLAQSVLKLDFADPFLNLKKTKLPLAAVYGQQDQLCYTDPYGKMDFPLWKNEPIIIPDSGHLSHLDQTEKVAKIIAEFAEFCFGDQK